MKTAERQRLPFCCLRLSLIRCLRSLNPQSAIRNPQFPSLSDRELPFDARQVPLLVRHAHGERRLRQFRHRLRQFEHPHALCRRLELRREVLAGRDAVDRNIGRDAETVSVQPTGVVNRYQTWGETSPWFRQLSRYGRPASSGIGSRESCHRVPRGKQTRPDGRGAGLAGGAGLVLSRNCPNSTMSAPIT
jgi:hypothetical protein